MKNLLRGFATLILTAIPICLFGAGNNWMNSINGSLPISQFSIPGTHDSGALYEPVSGTAKCQNLTIADQLNAGVRFLDIRCRHINDAFAIHHGSVYQNMNFDDVLNAVIGFLNSNPSECVIMSVKEEYNPTGNTRSFEATFDSYVAKNPSKWSLGSSIPNLSQVRGKIVLFRRFGASSLPKGIDASNWPDNTTFSSGVLRVQDWYNVSNNNTKWSYITSLLNEAYYGGSGTLFVNFSSGVQSIFGIPNIPSVANNINPKLTSYFTTYTSGRYGIIAMDFADAAKCALIYNTSFPAPGPIADGTYQVVNVNSGKVLDVSGASLADGANILQWTYYGQANQQWIFTGLGGGSYKIAAVHSGKVLNIDGWSTANGTYVDQWVYVGQGNQVWQVISNGDGSYRILNRFNGLALDVVGLGTADGVNVDQWTWNGGANQKWRILAP
jgi:Ricin-type beta-trefoil lectin domain-like/Phosphatidylinositol-specific phospholipase C, X domain